MVLPGRIRGQTRGLSLRDFHPSWVGRGVRMVDWSYFQEIYRIFFLEKSESIKKGFLKSPYQNGPALAQMVSRAYIKAVAYRVILFQMKE